MTDLGMKDAGLDAVPDGGTPGNAMFSSSAAAGRSAGPGPVIGGTAASRRRHLATTLRAALPAVAFAVLLGTIFAQQPRTMSYLGLNLLLNLALPVVLATMAQMLVIMLGDLDLSIGPFVSLVTCIGSAVLPARPVAGVALLALAVAGYAATGALIGARNLPAIVVTLGLSFVWLGLAVILLPTPGGLAPEWLSSLMRTRTPGMPLVLWASVGIALLMHVGLMRSALGTVMRGMGGNPRAVARAGWSLLRLRVLVYALAGGFGVLAGLALLGLTTSGDANLAGRYTLLSIAAVILGGGEFTGGRLSPSGAVLGALTLTLAASLLTFLNVPQDWQIGVQGGILIAVLALRAGIERIGRPDTAAA